jgi:Tfp pilus assembly protein PilP
MFHKLAIGSVLLLATLTGLAQADQTAFRVAVADVDAAAFVTTTSDIAAINVAVGADINVPEFSFAGSYDSARSYYKAIADKLLAVAEVRNRIVVLRHQCSTVSDRKLPDSLGSGVVSFHFHGKELLSLLQWVLQTENASFEVQAEERQVGELPMFVRMKDVSAKAAVEAVLAANGLALTERQPGRFYVQRLAATPECHRAPTKLAEPPPFRVNAVKANYCPYRYDDSDPKSKGCQPLEFYNLGSLRSKGYISVAGRPAVIIKSPDGFLWGARVGHYLGKHWGRITEISDQGIQLKELVLDENRIWQESATALPHASAQ